MKDRSSSTIESFFLDYILNKNFIFSFPNYLVDNMLNIYDMSKKKSHHMIWSCSIIFALNPHNFKKLNKNKRKCRVLNFDVNQQVISYVF